MDWKLYTTYSQHGWGYKRTLLPRQDGDTLKYIEKQGFNSSTEAFEAMEKRYTSCGYELHRVDAWTPAYNYIPLSSASGAGGGGI